MAENKIDLKEALAVLDRSGVQAAEAKGPVMDRIRKLQGADEFIALCEEVSSMAPVLLEQKLSHVLTERSYLLSIDPGCGCSTLLDLFAELLTETGLFRFEDSPIEIKIPYESGKPEILLNLSLKISEAEGIFLCFDISEWMEHVFDPEFRDFLLDLNRNETNIYAFRVPYLEQNVLYHIGMALSDVLTVKTVTMIPLTMEQLRLAAEQRIEDAEYQADDSAWEMFRQRMMDEKTDGRFYGIRTAHKVADEMIYEKIRNSVTDDGQDRVIRAEHLPNLVWNKKEERSAEEQLNALVGIEGIRDQLEEILSQIEFARKDKGVEIPAMHMQFIGNPGTGKTTVARIVGKIFRERGILPNGYFLEHAGNDFIGQYIGHTAPRTMALCRDAYGSVLFIDEAYALADNSYRDGSGFAREAVDTLVAQMENHRNDMVVIMAGYPKEMEKLMKLNPGLAGRMPYVLNFPNYTREQLADIFFRMMQENSFRSGEGLEQIVRSYFDQLTDNVINAPDFSNARFVRNLFEQTWSKTIIRAQVEGKDPKIIMPEDFELADRENTEMLNGKKITRANLGYRLGLV